MHSYPYPRPALTADLIALTWHRGALKLLLIQRSAEPFKGQWALPGGFVDEGESPREAAARELNEEAGLSLSADELISLGLFAEPGRDPRGWVVSAAMIALLPPLPRDERGAEPLPQLRAGDDAREARWWALSELDQLELAFDHQQIIREALAQLRVLTQTSTAPLRLLPTPFRHRQARALYNQLWGSPLPASSFKAWLRRVEALERTGRALYQARPDLRLPWQR